MVRNNFEAGVKVKCIKADMPEVPGYDIQPVCVNREDAK